MSEFVITPIGTCRIHTPLRRAKNRYRIHADHRRNYGFVHSSAEALQLVRFLQAEKHFRPEVAPLVARDADLAKHEAESWSPSDLHIVEISSAKRISSGPDIVQSNYLSHHFADFFASAERSRTFWSLVKKAHRQELVDYLERQQTYQLLGPQDRELLVSLHMEPQSFKAVKSDMAEIAERIGRDRLVFATHVNAAGPDGELIPARDRLIRWVKMAADQLGAELFDPTSAMQDFGQEKALESAGLDLTHYTPAFYDRVYDEVHRLHVVPRMGASASTQGESGDDRAAREAARLEAMLEIGDFFATSREVHAAVEQSPDALPLIELRGLIRSRIGDFHGAIEDLTHRGDDGALSQAMRVGLVEALNASGAYDSALRVARGLLAEEYESAALYGAAAEAAERAGQIDAAIGYAKQAFRQDRNSLAAGLHALILLIEHRSEAESAAWRREVLENARESANGAFETAMWAIRNRDEELFAAAIKAVAPLDKGGTIDLLEDALAAGMHVGVARSIEVAAALGRIPRSASERRLAIIDESLAKSRELFADGKLSEAYEIASGLLPLEDVSSSQIAGRKLAAEARQLLREMARQVRTDIRNAYQEEAFDEVVRIGEAAGDLLIGFPDGAILYARALHSDGRTGEALDLVKRAYAVNPDSLVAARWAARLSAIAGDYATALETYGALRRSKDPGARKIESELHQFFSRAGPRALKQLRRLIVDGSFEEALRLARLIKEEAGSEESVDRELNRLHAFLRRRLREVEQGDGDAEEGEAILRHMVEVRPTDTRMLRKLALQLMAQLRFAEAAEIWDRIHSVDPENDPASRQRERCLKMAQRRAAAWTVEVEAA